MKKLAIIIMFLLTGCLSMDDICAPLEIRMRAAHKETVDEYRESLRDHRVFIDGINETLEECKVIQEKLEECEYDLHRR